MRITFFGILLVVSFLFKVQFDSHAAEKYSPCKLPKGEVIKIGCTTTCGRFNQWAMRSAAKRAGYKIRYQNIYSKNQSVDLSQLDGILIPGGADINPDYYTSSLPEDLKKHIESLDYLVDYTTSGKVRDPFEYGLLQNYFSDSSKRYTPILGICRGMQMLTVSQGIPLYVDLKKELGIRNRRYTLDKVHVTNKESVIYDVMKKSRFRAVEIHHQGLRMDYYLKNKSQWPQLEVTGLSHGGRIAEVLEFYNRPVLGVQFHPEYTFGKVRRRVFGWFLNKACHKKNLERNKNQEGKL
jgi:putative glutamine amidotransferase